VGVRCGEPDHQSNTRTRAPTMADMATASILSHLRICAPLPLGLTNVCVDTGVETLTDSAEIIPPPLVSVVGALVAPAKVVGTPPPIESVVGTIVEVVVDGVDAGTTSVEVDTPPDVDTVPDDVDEATAGVVLLPSEESDTVKTAVEEGAAEDASGVPASEVMNREGAALESVGLAQAGFPFESK